MRTKLSVKLITHTPNVEDIVASAAKLCYSPMSIDELMHKVSGEDNAEFIKMLMDMGHESPLEHVAFTFGIEGVSRALLAQLTRHRIASYSVKSQRYVKESQFNYIIPPAIAKYKESRDLFFEAMRRDMETYNKLVDWLLENYAYDFLATQYPHYQGKPFVDLLKRNHPSDYAKFEKQAIEDARFVLPNACETKLILTMNARSLLNFFRERCCKRAQWEIRELAEEMLELVREVAPALFANAGADCWHGECKQGKYKCGG